MTNPEQYQPSDEEKKLTKGMPPHIAAGFIAARRKSQKPTTLEDLSQQLMDLSKHLWDKS